MKKFVRSFGFRLVAGLLLFFGLYGGTQLAIQSLPAAAQPTAMLLGGALLLALYAALFRRWEQRPVGELALGRAPADLLRGAGCGFGMIALAVGIMAVAGCYRIEAFRFDIGQLLRMIGWCWIVAVGEEILFRGILCRMIAAKSRPVALLVSGLLFGLAHLFNPEATLWSAFAIAVEAGFMLAAAYLWSGSLWLPVGIHWAWNFGLGYLFGLPVSGDTSYSWVTATVSGPAWLTGGPFGPENALQTLLLGGLLTAWFLGRPPRKTAD